MPHSMKVETKAVLGQLYDYLLAHPFYNTTVRRVLDLSPDEDVTENELFQKTLTELVDQSLLGLIVINNGGKES